MIRVKNLYNRYQTKESTIEVLNDISIQCEKNEFVSIIGPSGCGKSTLFKIIAGIINDYEGQIEVQGSIIYMHQNDNLMPWRTIYRNIMLPYEIKKTDPDGTFINQLIKEFELDGFMELYPHQLSGGMKKRASLLRAYLTDCDIMLLDEPFGSLDALTKQNMYKWLLDIWSKHKKTVLFITHDIEEAIYLSDRIYVMGKRPATIVDEINIEFKRPRNSDMLLGQQYLEYKKRLMESLAK
ncbi:MAG: ABC transporter ATP-binding protein [Clostridia bacterium]|nr:ABC transporter ATP-binding protein [Clostridia bacterium]